MKQIIKAVHQFFSFSMKVAYLVDLNSAVTILGYIVVAYCYAYRFFISSKRFRTKIVYFHLSVYNPPTLSPVSRDSRSNECITGLCCQNLTSRSLIKRLHATQLAFISAPWLWHTELQETAQSIERIRHKSV